MSGSGGDDNDEHQGRPWLIIAIGVGLLALAGYLALGPDITAMRSGGLVRRLVTLALSKTGNWPAVAVLAAAGIGALWMGIRRPRR